MCTPKSKGGQRCPSEARKGVESAEKRYDALAAKCEAVRAEGKKVPLKLVERTIRADFKRADARAIYASTEEGERVLTERLAQVAPGGGGYGDAGAMERVDLREALNEGRFLRDRNARIKDDVKAGRITPAQGAAESVYPLPQWAAQRERNMQGTLERLRQQRATGPQSRPSAPVAPRPVADPRGSLQALVASDRLSEQGRARYEQMSAYYDRYDAMVRQSLTPEGEAALRARLAELPKVGSGYHSVNTPRNPSPEQQEAMDIQEVLDDKFLHQGMSPEQIPTPAAESHRAASILAAIRDL